MKIILTLFILFSLSIHGICADSGSEVLLASTDKNSPQSNENSDLTGTLNNFNFEGKPVHPGCVREFEVSLADSPPPIVHAVDVKACVSSNEFSVPITADDQGYLSYEYDLGDGEKGIFSYKYLGMSDGGIYVLRTRSRGGGTMVAETLFLLETINRIYWNFDDDNKPIRDKRLIMRCNSQIILGDRDRGVVTLKGNNITLGPSRYREKEETIDIDVLTRNIP